MYLDPVYELLYQVLVQIPEEAVVVPDNEYLTDRQRKIVELIKSKAMCIYMDLMVKSELRVCPNSVVDQTYEQLLVNRDILFPLKNELVASILNSLLSSVQKNYPPPLTIS